MEDNNLSPAPDPILEPDRFMAWIQDNFVLELNFSTEAYDENEMELSVTGGLVPIEETNE